MYIFSWGHFSYLMFIDVLVGFVCLNIDTIPKRNSRFIQLNLFFDAVSCITIYIYIYIWLCVCVYIYIHVLSMCSSTMVYTSYACTHRSASDLACHEWWPSDTWDLLGNLGNFHGNPLELLGFTGKSLDFLEINWKYWDLVGNHENSWDLLGLVFFLG